MLDMIKCSTGGAYYARGEWVPADGEASAALAAKGFDAAAIENAKTGTMAYSILQGPQHQRRCRKSEDQVRCHGQP